MFSKWSNWLSPRVESPGLDLVLRLTLIELLLRPMGFWAVRASILLLAALGLLFPKILRAPLTWFAMSLFVGWRIIDDWPLSDNHIYLLGYWCLALGIALITVKPQENAGVTSRYLIGLAFAFAVLWKAFLSPEYMDGRFFRVQFNLDPRFEYSVLLFTDLTSDQLKQNREYLLPLPGNAELLEPPMLTEPESFKTLVRFATWGTLLMELVIALVFLVPLPERLRFVRHLFLLLFCTVTYAFAPVAGFGWLLLVMGLVLCSEQQKVWRVLYVSCYVLVLLYSEIPWSHLLYRFQTGF